jgi:hypothetical protein
MLGTLCTAKSLFFLFRLLEEIPLTTGKMNAEGQSKRRNPKLSKKHRSAYNYVTSSAFT